MAYRHIASLHLYGAARQVLERNHIPQIAEEALSVQPGSPALVETASGSLRARWVFDSRPPRFLPARANEICLAQSFLGYRLRLPEGKLDPDAFEMMHFGVEQDGGTQFVYTLPYARNEALVELTRFGRERLDPARAALLLDAYIREQFGPYEQLGTERGCIPMCSAAPEAEEGPGLLPLGTRAGLLKPSTGYGIKAMQAHAEQIAEALAQQSEADPESLRPRRRARFAFYDRLLLLILAHWPGQGKRIFQRLFRSSSAAQVLRFLDEASSPWEEAQMFARLPWGPFLRALGIELGAQLRPLRRPLLLLAWAAALAGIQAFWAEGAQVLGYGSLLLGLIAVGIPHGAVDHLLESSRFDTPIRPRFVIGYIALGAALLPLWLWQPGAALLLFLAYSAWHFGQADFREWRIGEAGHPLAFGWGLALLAAILLPHPGELLPILAGLGIELGGASALQALAGSGPALAGLLLLCAGLWAWRLRSLPFLLSVLLLALSARLPLLIAFGLYFVGQHSISGWSHIKAQMQVSSWALFIKALPFHAGAWLLLGLFYAAYGFSGSPQAWQGGAAYFFMFLSCLSFPHVWAMHRFYQRG
jgi:lycopene beta-cyclase